MCNQHQDKACRSPQKGLSCHHLVSDPLERTVLWPLSPQISPLGSQTSSLDCFAQHWVCEIRSYFCGTLFFFRCGVTFLCVNIPFYWWFIHPADGWLLDYFQFLTLVLILFYFINLFIYFWLRWVFVAARELSLAAASRGHSSLRCVGFSLRRLLLLRSTGSRHAGFSGCGTRASLLCGMWDLPGPGLEPMSPALAGGFLTIAPPGKPLSLFLKYLFSKNFSIKGKKWKIPLVP